MVAKNKQAPAAPGGFREPPEPTDGAQTGERRVPNAPRHRACGLTHRHTPVLLLGADTRAFRRAPKVYRSPSPDRTWFAPPHGPLLRAEPETANQPQASVMHPQAARGRPQVRECP